ncbi:MAG TPA: rhamnogalacturonan lyase B N-terminal domain-containing protein [Tepidisphaeraceae bacterium]|jgi:rhamnogalacturonan endolyase
MKFRRSRVAPIEALEPRTLLAFGLTTTSSAYTVDTGANLVFSIARTAGSGSRGDLTSIKFNGVEYEAPFSSTSRFSHYESGLSGTTVVSATVDPAGNWIKITCDDTAGVGVIQYYVAHKNENKIYMATYAPGPSSPSPGEMRFITYLNWSIFTNHPNPSDTSAIHGTAQTAIESSDVFQDPVDGQTHSKYYGETRMIENVYHGATGASAGAFMFMGNRESSSGGPFFKDIDFQSTGASVELYNYMFSGHSQTENFRPGLQGPYALAFTSGSAPTAPDYSFLDGVGLTGWVSPSGRGTVTGTASGVPAGHPATVGLSNATAQYWATPDGSGHYTISGIKPGTYTETLYQDELAVGTRTVTVNAGAATGADITDTYYLPPAIFRIGTWDGTPREFLNGDKITDMHPSDPRLSPWAADAGGMTNFIIGTSPDSAWPMAEWKFQNTNASGPFMDLVNRITFNLTAAQAATAMTFRIGITRLDHGRPSISVNGAGQSVPGLTSQPDTRGLTLGNWRGNNSTFTWNIATSAMHAGTNTIDITCASGSGSGGNWLSPWHIYDALDLVTTASITNAPVVTSITLNPPNPNVGAGAAQQFTAAARDQFNNTIAANLVWSATGGNIDQTGLFTAPPSSGPVTITATSGAVNGNTGVTVYDTSPVPITGSSFDYQTRQAIVISFGRNVGASLTADDLVLQNLNTLATIPSSALTFSYSSNTATFTANSILPDGYYRATLPTAAVQDAFGVHPATDTVVNFFVLGGDANHDGIVDQTDLGILSQNWGQTGATFGQGDFDYNGIVNVDDLNILSAHWQQSLTLPTNSPAPAKPVRMPRRIAGEVLPA